MQTVTVTVSDKGQVVIPVQDGFGMLVCKRPGLVPAVVVPT